MLNWLRLSGRYLFEHLEAVFNVSFGDRYNPFYYLGSLAFFFFWIVAVSGLYLYAFFETSMLGAYSSIEYLTVDQWYLGGVFRSLHRYASDAMVITMGLHMLRELVMDRYRGVRWFSWFTGIPLIWLVYASGIGGYWLVWDQMAQYIAVMTSEWLDWLPIINEPMARNFINQASLSDRFFSLLAFLHIGIPLMLLLVMWIHIQRLSNPRTNPPRVLMVGSILAMLVLSLIKPAVSQAPANLDLSVSTIDIDWFYLFVYPLMEKTSAGTLWILASAISLFLALLPWMPPLLRKPAVVVNLDNCNGCERCYEDCPYSAITMEPRSDGLDFEKQAMVQDSMCISCGLCVGACPTATPFRRKTDLIPGIELPDHPLKALREAIIEQTATLEGDQRVLLMGCDYGVNLDKVALPGVVAIKLPCVAALPPSFLDFVISRKHADGVLLTGCHAGDCHERFGIEWLEQRLAGKRDPMLRKRVPRERIVTFWAGEEGGRKLLAEVSRFQQDLAVLGPYTPPQSDVRRRASGTEESA
ncbi:MAG TPA: hydrogenase iron-sulfur subunit [Gammaproteobacteria bacterium]|nr:hydrogenase iron-sulfur subunit [Gammaproteobacteria bacterium]